MMTTESTKAFYDEFLYSRMLSYRLQGNLRLDRATERILPFLREDSLVLDIGCGIGIVSERLAAVTSMVQTPVNVITFIDIIEHIPQSAHSMLFENLRSISSEIGVIILTYSSPQYQRHLYENNLEDRRIVDEIIDIDHFLDVAHHAGHHPK